MDQSQVSIILTKFPDLLDWSNDYFKVMIRGGLFNTEHVGNKQRIGGDSERRLQDGSRFGTSTSHTNSFVN